MSKMSDYEQDVRAKVEYMLFTSEPVEYIRQAIGNEFGPACIEHAEKIIKEHGYEG